MSTLPPALSDALGHMQRIIACPEDVKARIAALRVPVQEVSGTRNWRSPREDRGHREDRGRGGRQDGYAKGGSGFSSRDAGGASWHHHPPRAPRRPFAERAHFGNKGNKDATTESRMMDRIRGKMNMFAESTYDTTKAWLSELMDSGETEFLDGFITLVFEKAASEPGLTSLYAKLLVELRAAFAHIDDELRRIFGDFQQIFTIAAAEPAVGSDEYGAFIKSRERRRYRRGYASFIGEIARGKALTADDVMGTCSVILDGMFQAKAAPDNVRLVEEYADCLRMLCKGAAPLIAWATIIPKVQQAQDRTGAPSMSQKARFALMDITDEFGPLA